WMVWDSDDPSVESRMGAVAWAMRQLSVSHPRSSNRTGRSPASGSPTGFTARHTTGQLRAGVRDAQTEFSIDDCTRNAPYKACSGFTRVPARRPSATFVTRLQPVQLPARAARQLPEQSTTLRVRSSSTGNPRLRGTLPITDFRAANRNNES